ncbi:metallophosphoesterase 1-like isoform X2 [Branchiostoma lanceolatum]|uniref:metallophosphoesterase 1-like isoform X2 n=1 Tax=Branchiostoma lanceolatum TaxID=7740 RepID=UPI00345387A1
MLSWQQVRYMMLTRRQLAVLCVGLGSVFLFSEYVLYYIAIWQCFWPHLELERPASIEPQKGRDISSPHQPIRVLFLADTHLLGSRQGHWFDRLRREWQMERSFQTAVSVHQPHAVFLLGDLLDEGKWCSDKEFWEEYLVRSRRMFRHNADVQFHVVVGNHDIGFHYEFLLVNSVALDEDGCFMCAAAEEQLKDVSLSLNCTRGLVGEENAGKMQCKNAQKLPNSSPILLMHYPLYRESDANCTGPDSAPYNEKYTTFKAQYDVVSQSASQKLLWWLQPRLVLTAHIHHGCVVHHPDGTLEHTLPSFSWRNRNNPSFLMAVIHPTGYSLTKCFLPKESSVIILYVISILLLLVWTCAKVRQRRRLFLSKQV